MFAQEYRELLVHESSTIVGPNALDLVDVVGVSHELLKRHPCGIGRLD